MTQGTLATGQVQTGGPINLILVVASAVADLTAVSAILATIVKQDSLLILLIIVAAMALVGAIYRFRRPILRSVVLLLIFFIASVLLAVVFWSLLASSAVTPTKVSITDPQEMTPVTMQYLVKGTVSDPNSRVYVIVHPLRVSEMWVQQSPIVDGEGNWQSSATFGTESLGIGERYQVIAVATNDNSLVAFATGNLLREGQKLTSLPRKSNRSSLITVTRPK